MSFKTILAIVSSLTSSHEGSHIQLFFVVVLTDRAAPSDHCVIFNPDENATKVFVQSLREQFRLREMFTSHGRQISMQTLYIDSNIGNMTNQDFEFVILESALANIVNKFRYKTI